MPTSSPLSFESAIAARAPRWGDNAGTVSRVYRRNTAAVRCVYALNRPYSVAAPRKPFHLRFEDSGPVLRAHARERVRVHVLLVVRLLLAAGRIRIIPHHSSHHSGPLPEPLARWRGRCLGGFPGGLSGQLPFLFARHRPHMKAHVCTHVGIVVGGASGVRLQPALARLVRVAAECRCPAQRPARAHRPFV
eukprot:scaffold22239_cov60-Phaeocystis_antarctica.AAC.2